MTTNEQAANDPTANGQPAVNDPLAVGTYPNDDLVTHAAEQKARYARAQQREDEIDETLRDVIGLLLDVNRPPAQKLAAYLKDPARPIAEHLAVMPQHTQFHKGMGLIGMVLRLERDLQQDRKRKDG